MLPAHVKTKLDLIVENEIERFKLIRDFEKQIEQLKKSYASRREIDEIIPIEKLQLLDEKDFYDYEYYEKYKEYSDLIKFIEKEGKSLLDSLYSFFEAQESALRLYNNQVNEMYINFVSEVTATHNKELEERKKRMQQEPLERKELRDKEEKFRRAIHEEQERLSQINSEYSKLISLFKSATTTEEKARIEKQIKKKQEDIEIIKGRISRLQDWEYEERRQLDDLERATRTKIHREIEQNTPSIALPKPPKSVSKPTASHVVPVAVPTTLDITPAPTTAPAMASVPMTTQTSQTQTLVPLNAFKFIEKNNQRYLEPINSQKAEDLERINKKVKSVLMLDPNRYKRKLHITRSRKN